MNRLTLPHQLLLLELDDDTGSSLQRDSFRAHYGLSGAVIAELMWQERLIPIAADRFILKPGRPPADGALKLAEDRLSETRPRKMHACISRLRITLLRRALLAELVTSGMLREEQERWLLVFRRRRWHPTPDSPEQTLIEHLRDHVAQADERTPPQREDLLLSLLRATKLLETVWSPDELLALRPQIDARTERAPIGRQVHQAIKTARAAAMAAAAGS
ncbi:MAG: hypothetical protein ACI8S6_005503 [Myxococcota bacterium]